MNIQREIIKTINLVAERVIGDKMSDISLDIAATIMSSRTTSGVQEYQVQINGTAYWLKVGTNISPAVGSTVWVHIPNGNYTNAFILANKV